MADDLNRLLVKIEADTSKLRSALNDAQAGVDRAASGMQRSLNRHSSSFNGHNVVSRHPNEWLQAFPGTPIAGKLTE